MPNFSIFTQIKNDLNDFYSNKVQLASLKNKDSRGVRYARRDNDGYNFSQYETISLIDLYHNSKFEDGAMDKLGQKKIFMNVGKFRTEVGAKQTTIRLKDFRFFPDDYADPYTAIFMQEDFKNWAKDCYFAEEVEMCIENFPKYGTIVLKKVGNELHFMPLQLLRNEQTAKDLQVASYVIEEHPDMTYSEMADMPEWNMEGVTMKFTDTATVYERYGRVPLVWLKRLKKETIEAGDENKSVDALVIVASKNISGEKPEGHIFFAEEITDRPYREAHWSRQHGRWLGIGEMENQFPNQTAKNIVINLLRRSLHWSGKRLFKTNMSELIGKNMVRDVSDGEILEVGPNGTLENIDMSVKSLPEFTTFMNEWEKNSDQKSFTYEVATGESMPSGTPFRLGVVLSNAVNSHFKAKQDKLGKFFKRAVLDFLVPQFLKDMGNKERTLNMFSGATGFETLKDAALKYITSETARISLMTGKVVDGNAIAQALGPFQAMNSLFFTIPANKYKEAKWKFDLDLTGESVDIAGKLESLKSLYQVMSATGDPRAEKVLERIAAVTGEDLSQFGPKPEQPVVSPIQAPQLKTTSNANGQGATA